MRLKGIEMIYATLSLNPVITDLDRSTVVKLAARY